MTELPTKYMRVTRNLTSYWGAYPPSAAMEPGMIGRSRDGVFVRETYLKAKPGYDERRFTTERQRNFEAVTTWTTHNVALSVIKADANAPGGVASGGVKLRFGGADEAAIICNGPVLWSYANQDAVRDYMRQLLDRGHWDVEQCLVTEVVLVDSAWVCFATDKDQSAEIRAKAALSLPAAPVETLKAVAGDANLVATSKNEKSAGFFTTVAVGGTPLFRAVKFSESWWAGVTGKIEYTKGIVEGASAFEEPEFG